MAIGMGEEKPASKAEPDPKRASDTVPLRERETTPAPTSTTVGRTAFPSTRPTTVPDFDVSAIALGSSISDAPLSGTAPEAAVPLRTRALPQSTLSHRLAFVLFHVDGESSLAEIAHSTQLSVDDVQIACLELQTLGLLQFRNLPGRRSGSWPRQP